MPLMDGFEAARAIRRFEHSSGCDRATIVAVTGLGDIAAQERAFASGMDLFLTKPVKMKEVRDVLEGVREGKGEGEGSGGDGRGRGEREMVGERERESVCVEID